MVAQRPNETENSADRVRWWRRDQMKKRMAHADGIVRNETEKGAQTIAQRE